MRIVELIERLKLAHKILREINRTISNVIALDNQHAAEITYTISKELERIYEVANELERSFEQAESIRRDIANLFPRIDKLNIQATELYHLGSEEFSLAYRHAQKESAAYLNMSRDYSDRLSEVWEKENQISDFLDYSFTNCHHLTEKLRSRLLRSGSDFFILFRLQKSHLDRALSLTSELDSTFAIRSVGQRLTAEESAQNNLILATFKNKTETIHHAFRSLERKANLMISERARWLYGNVSFPEWARIGVQYSLHVHITQSKHDDLAPLLKISFSSPSVAVNINVIVANYNDAFDIDDSNQKSVKITADNHPDPIIFWVTPKKVGDHQLYVDFFQDGRYLGRREVHTTVMPAKPAARPRQTSFPSAPLPTSESSPTSSPPLAINPLWPAPDLVIRIQKITESKYQFTLASAVLALNFEETQSQDIILRLDKAPHAYMQNLFSQLDYRRSLTTLDEDVYWGRLHGLGTTLYEQLFPEDLKAIYWNQIHENKNIKTIQILSEEAWIPWELIRPYRRLEDTVEEGLFLSEKFQLSRWYAGCNAGSQRVNLRHMRALFGDLNLDAVAKEREALTELAQQMKLALESVDPTTAAVFALLKQGDFNCLHFACHGEFNVDNPDRSQLRLSHGQQLQPSDISGERITFGKDRPLIFLNACETGRADNALIGLGGWIPQFLRAGAAAFIGTMWEASDASAHRFAVAFYSKLLNGATIGEAAQHARLAIKETGDPTWLAYTVFGDPNLKITRS